MWIELKFQMFRKIVKVGPVAALCLVASVSQGETQSRSGFDPRSWGFDSENGVLLTPSSERERSREPAASSQRVSAEPARIVRFNESQRPGTLVIQTSQRALYYVLNGGQAIRYSVGVGREGFAWSGADRISAKREWPDWHPPSEMRQREAAAGRTLPARVEGGPNNPLGARALYIGDTLYRVHGTNEPWTVGTANSSGCIRMTNADVIDLYGRVQVGAQVIVRH